MGKFTTIQSTGFNITPRVKFSVLFLAAGYDMGKIFELANDAWARLVAFSPFEKEAQFNRDFRRKRFAAYCDLDPLNIDFQRDGKRLIVPEVQRDHVLNRINTSTVPLNFTDQNLPKEWPARIVWEPEGRFGDWGSLIVVLVKGDTEGELYQLSPSPEVPMPFVAVVVTGDHWHKVAARAVAQVWGYLADEYEEAGDAYRVAPLARLDRRRPNVLLLDNTQRTSLRNGSKFLSVLDSRPNGWSVGKEEVLSFHAHPSSGASPDDTLQKAKGGIQLVEGGAGYRLNAVRPDFDCLMRRKPYSSALPIQDKEAQFCSVCRYILDSSIVSNRDRSLDSIRILLDSQRPLTDTIFWKKINRTKKPAVGLEGAGFIVGPKGAKWGYKYRLDADLGLKFFDIRLSDLSGIIYGPVMDVFEHIGFQNLSVKFAGDNARSLPFSEAFANKTSPPVFEEFEDAHDRRFMRGYRLGLTWSIPDRWDIEAILSIVFKDVDNDFDPGGAVYAVKCYPQLAMRYRRPPAGSKKGAKLPNVEELSGTIELVPNNVIPPSLATSLPHHAHHMATGKQSVALFTDSNASGWDSEWDWDRLDVAEFGADFLEFLNDVSFGIIPGAPPLPPYGLWKADWKKGRLLQSVGWGSMLRPASLVGAIARRATMFFDQPGLPHWSWLFDYSEPEITGTRHLIGCYSSKDTALGGAKANTLRVQTHKWPTTADQRPIVGNISLNRDYTMTVEKYPRQGMFDSVHIHPDMGRDARNRKIVAAPFCGDLCMHLHWRWGVVALVGSPWRQRFLGWGNGRLDQGARTLAGAPLIPPNQHLLVKLEKRTGETSIRYEVRADDPDFDAYQVFMEQGIGLAFNYGGLDSDMITLLAIGVGEWKPSNVAAKPAELRTLQKSDPAKYDATVRELYHKFYPRIRFYSEPDVKDDVQQISEAGTNTTLENL